MNDDGQFWVQVVGVFPLWSLCWDSRNYWRRCDSHHQIVSLSCSESDVYRIGKDRIFFGEDGRIICNLQIALIHFNFSNAIWVFLSWLVWLTVCSSIGPFFCKSTELNSHRWCMPTMSNGWIGGWTEETLSHWLQVPQVSPVSAFTTFLLTTH